MNRIWKNTAANYLFVLSRMIEGLLLARWTYSTLGTETYGFWGLLWSIFMGTILLDLGYGKAAQRCTAEGLHKKDPLQYSRTVSSVFGLFILLAFVIVAGTFVAVEYLGKLTRVTDPEELRYFANALWIFGIGTAVIFPFSIFPEILTGLQKIYIKSNILTISRIVELAAVLVSYRLGGRLYSLILCTLIPAFGSYLMMFYMVKQSIPTLRLSWKIHWPTLKDLASFSIFNLLFSGANLLINYTSQLILSVITGLANVGIYQLGSRLPFMANTFLLQYQENLYPLSAALHSRNDVEGLRKLLANSLRFCSFLATGPLVFAWLFTPEFLQILFKANSPEAATVCRIMLLSVYCKTTYRSVSNRFFMMTGHHKFQGWLSCAEAAADLVLGILLLKSMGIAGVVWGTFLPNLLIVLTISLPFLLWYTRGGLLLFFRVTVLPLLLAGIAGTFSWEFHRLFSGNQTKIVLLGLNLFMGGCIYLISAYCFLLNRNEKKQLLSSVIKVLPGSIGQRFQSKA
ncbi:MAG: oligosaccharide flippase family protein [Victivallaceae bacterium]|nr:oligosaccharide flippase family protein [Victivallaceae bacterium]